LNNFVVFALNLIIVCCRMELIRSVEA